MHGQKPVNWVNRTGCTMQELGANRLPDMSENRIKTDSYFTEHNRGLTGELARFLFGESISYGLNQPDKYGWLRHARLQSIGKCRSLSLKTKKNQDRFCWREWQGAIKSHNRLFWKPRGKILFAKRGQKSFLSRLDILLSTFSVLKIKKDLRINVSPCFI